MPARSEVLSARTAENFNAAPSPEKQPEKSEGKKGAYRETDLTQVVPDLRESRHLRGNNLFLYAVIGTEERKL